MEESRVSKYQAYRDSIEKKDSASFSTPQKEISLSDSQRLFLKIKFKKRTRNIIILSICLALAIAIVVMGIIVFK